MLMAHCVWLAKEKTEHQARAMQQTAIAGDERTHRELQLDNAVGELLQATQSNEVGEYNNSRRCPFKCRQGGLSQVQTPQHRTSQHWHRNKNKLSTCGLQLTINVMSPPSSWTAGLMRVSSSSLIMATTSSSSSSAVEGGGEERNRRTS